MQTVCLIADLVDSRMIDNRHDVQKRLLGILDQCNESSAARLLSPLTITLGDEFQAVYRDWKRVFPDIVKIIRGMYPERIRFSVSQGLLSTDINPVAAMGMDGPAFYSARDRLEELKKLKKTILAVNGPDPVPFRLANHGLLLFSDALEGWNVTALDCFYGLLEGQSVKLIGSSSKVSLRTLYKSIHSNNIRDYANFMTELPELLSGGKE